MTAIDSALPDAVRSLLVLLRRNLQFALGARQLEYTPPEAQIVQLIRSHPGISSMELVAHTGYDKSVIARKLAALERRGLVRKCADPRDNRRLRLSLTEQGAEQGALLSEALLEVHQQTFAALSEDEQQQLIRLIGKCLEGQ